MPLLVGELYALLLLEKKAFTKGLAEAQAEAKAAGGGISSTLLGIGKVTAVGLAALVIGLGAVGLAAIHASVDFQRGMANIQTLIGKGSAADKRVLELAEDVKTMSISTGKSLSDLQRGLYDVIGTFTDTADSAKWLEIAAKAGAAGLSTTHDAILLLSAVTKAYGDSSIAAAQKASDLIFETANLGVTTFPEMAQSMGKVLPIAAALKVKEEELFGAMAALTGVTGDTALVTTQLRSTMNAFLKPNTLMRQAIKETGFESGQAIVQALGLSGALKLIAGTSVAGERGIAAVFGRVESLTAVLALSGAQADDWAWKTTAMYHAAGKAQRAFEIQQATVGAMMDRIGAAFGVMAVNIGNKLMPAVSDALKWLEKAMPTIEDVVLKATDAIVAGIGAAVAVIGAIIDKIATVWSILGDLGMQGPIIAAAVGLITAAFVAWGIAAAGAAVGVIAATWPVLAVIAAIALAIKGLELVFNAFGITANDVFAWLGKTAQDFAHFFLGVVDAIVQVLAFIPGPLQGMANEWHNTLVSMEHDVDRWSQQVGKGMAEGVDAWTNDIGTRMQGAADDILTDNQIYDSYKKAGNKAGMSVIDQLKLAIANGVPVTEEDLKSLGITADEALAAGIDVGEPAVTGATKSLVEQFGYTIGGVKKAASKSGGDAMAEMAKAIADHRQDPLDQFDALVELMKTALTPMKLAAKIAGHLTGKALANAFKDSRPEVRAQAYAVAMTSIDQLVEIAKGGGKAGKKAMDALTAATKSKIPEVRTAAKKAKDALVTQLQAAKKPAANAGSAAAAAFGRAFQSRMDAFGAFHIRLAINADANPNRTYSGYASGSWKIPKNQMAFLHAGEMVIPAAAAARLRQDAYSPQFSAVDAPQARKSGPTIGTMNLTINAGGDVSRQSAQRFGQNVLDVVAGGLRQQTARTV